MSKYPRTVEAALAESRSKKALAEALAVEIPPRMGRGNDDVSQGLTEARQAIIDAGGEPKAVRTLADYRLTARWVAGLTGEEKVTGKPVTFSWVEGVSFTAHSEAWRTGLTLAAFIAEPMNTRRLRAEYGGPSKDGDPVGIVKGWSDEQRIQAAKELHHDPDVAQALVKDETSLGEYIVALTEVSDSGQKEAAFTPEREREGVFWTLQSKVATITRSLAELGTYLTAIRNDSRLRDMANDERTMLRGFATNLRQAADKLDVLADTESMDEALAKILDEDRA